MTHFLVSGAIPISIMVSAFVIFLVDWVCRRLADPWDEIEQWEEWDNQP